MTRAFLCGLLLVSPAFAQNLPDGPGKAEFIHNCLDCHSAGMVLRAKKTPDEWRKNVDDMAARGSDGSKEDIDKVVLYLDKYFAIDNSGAPATPQSTTPSSSSGGQTAPKFSQFREFEGAEHVFAGSGYLSYRRIEKQGTYTGPTWNGVGGRRTTAGKTVAVRANGQTDRDVRVMDAPRAVAAYSRQNELARYLSVFPSVFPPVFAAVDGNVRK
ncbi:MAG TPA: cytochrome c [Acidobacteriaceae bacterium]